MLREKLTHFFSRGASAGIMRGAAWMTYAYVGGYALQGAYFVILARLLGPSGLGTFAGALALVGAIASFSGCGGGNVLVMEGSRDADAIRPQLGTAVTLLAASGLVLTACIAALRFTVLGHFAFAALLLPFCVSELFAGRIVDLAGQCFQAREQLNVTASLLVILSALRLAAILIFALAGQGHSPMSFATWYVGASVLAAVWASIRVARVVGRPVFLRDRPLRVLLGLSFSLGTASKTIYGDIDKFMLASFSSAANTGIYTAAYRVVSIAFAPVFAFCYANNVRFFRAGIVSPTDIWRITRTNYPVIFLYTAGVAILLALTAPVVPLILGHNYEDSVAAIRWLAVMPIVQGAHSLFGDALMGSGRQALRAFAQLGAAALNVGLNLWLIPAFSWRGAAAASIICEGMLAIVLAIMLRRTRGMPTAPGAALAPPSPSTQPPRASTGRVTT